MKINCYFEFPCDYDEKINDFINCKLDAGVDPFLGNGRSDELYYLSSVLLFRAIKKKYPDFDVRPVDNHGMVVGNCPHCKFAFCYHIIENVETKKYFVISWADKLHGILHAPTWDLENCAEIFTGLGVHIDDKYYEKHTEIKYTPATSMTSLLSTYRRIEEYHKLKLPKHIPEKPYFRGGYYNVREWIGTHDDRFQFNPNRIQGYKFIEEIGQLAINIDINGAAEISCRTLDAMGLSSALIRPKLAVEFHNPLIPDYHYAALKCDDQSKLKELADAYIERFEDLKKDPDYVQFLSENGRKWYEENATLESYEKIYMKLLDFNKLL
jgi:hypothetical protein